MFKKSWENLEVDREAVTVMADEQSYTIEIYNSNKKEWHIILRRFNSLDEVKIAIANLLDLYKNVELKVYREPVDKLQKS